MSKAHRSPSRTVRRAVSGSAIVVALSVVGVFGATGAASAYSADYCMGEVACAARDSGVFFGLSHTDFAVTAGDQIAPDLGLTIPQGMTLSQWGVYGDGLPGIEWGHPLRPVGVLATPGDYEIRTFAEAWSSGDRSRWGRDMAPVHVDVYGKPAPGTFGSPYSYTLRAGGESQVGSLSSGTLPPGLTIEQGMIHGTPSSAGDFPFTVGTVNGHGVPVDLTTRVVVDPRIAGAVELTSAPASVAPGSTESDQKIRAFPERYNVVLPQAVTVGGVTIPAGTKVNSYLVHADAVGNGNSAVRLRGSIGFGARVLAVATTATDLTSTDGVLGSAGTTYSDRSDAGLESDDQAQLNADRSGLWLDLAVWSATDDIRVIVLAP